MVVQDGFFTRNDVLNPSIRSIEMESSAQSINHGSSRILLN